MGPNSHPSWRFFWRLNGRRNAVYLSLDVVLPAVLPADDERVRAIRHAEERLAQDIDAAGRAAVNAPVAVAGWCERALRSVDTLERLLSTVDMAHTPRAVAQDMSADELADFAAGLNQAVAGYRVELGRLIEAGERPDWEALSPSPR